MVSVSRKRSIIWLLFIAGLVLFCYGINSESIWYDEWYTINVVNQPSTQSFLNQIVLTENNPPIYYMLLRLWVLVGNSFSLVYLRLFSAVMAGIGVLVIYQFGKLLNGWKTGILSALLYVTSPYILWYAQEARNMAFASVVSMAIVIYFYRFCTNRTKKDFIIATILQAIGLYTHSFLLAFIPAQILYLLIKRDKKLLKQWSLAVVIVLVLYLFWAPFLAKQIMINKSYWLRSLSPFFPINMMVHFSVGIFQFSHPGLVVLSTCVYTSLFVASIFFKMDKKRRLTDQKLLLLFIFFMPIVLSVLISVLIKPILFEGRRYLIVVVPIFLVIVSMGLSKIKNRQVFVSVLVLVVLMNLFCMRNLYKYHQKRYWNRTSDYLSEFTRIGDGVFAVDHTRGAILNHSGGIGKAKTVSMPHNMFVRDNLYPYKRIWFITTIDPRRDKIKQAMDSSFKLVCSKTFTSYARGYINIFLYDITVSRRRYES